MKNNKKIGILTFHAAHNCGSMLQAYALKEILKDKYKQNVKIINYSNFSQRGMYGYLDLRLKKSAVINTFNRLKFLSYVRKSRADYEKFFKDYLEIIDKKISNHKSLKTELSKYDLLVSGGDQVWNIRCGDADIAYFLKYNDTAKKVAYSPSFGATNLLKHSKNPQIYIDLLKKYNALSIREGNGKKWLKEMLNIDVPIIADPTMLYSKDEWLKKLHIKDLNQKFIFYYAFSFSNKSNNENIMKLSKSLGLPVYVIDGLQYKKYNLDQYGFKLYDSTGPIAFLELMNSAQLVIVQSFHGIVFSALFEKQFWAIRNTKLVNPDDDRAIHILKTLKLTERLVNMDNFDSIDFMSKLEYTDDIRNNIVSMRNDAFKYIEKNIVE